ncbi:hypothetical protein QEV83_10960 [Methylocapsa sp. D3K7]|uniref:hypothetical protein n=1 Tax=Methylocapsa sp. D3K7 TaxID=3041435 RepID=UPI00244EBC4C|nr:hypothetical protein [Methylocapsa sp. D3K7]WGJ13235.1 hypothetical protein QEV83_10960 [Methylocapsa sp. D3K7]
MPNYVRICTRQSATKIKRDGDGQGGENHFRERRCPKYLLSNLTKCACYGGSYLMISADLIGCDNRTNIRRDRLGARAQRAALSHDGPGMEPELFKEFCHEFTREVNRLRIERGAGLTAIRDELLRIGRKLGKLLALLRLVVRSKPSSRI